MRKTTLFLMAFLLMGFQQTFANQPNHSNENDKEFLLNYFQENIDILRSKTADLSEEQLNFQSSDENWSILMCLEHIYLTEVALFEMVQTVLEQEATDEERGRIETTDEEILRNIVDRTARFKAPEMLHPVNTFNNAENAIEAITENRQVIFEIMEKYSIDEMRSKVADAPFGIIDGYQYLLFIAGHANRHSLQIDEIMASEEFPQ